MLDVAPVVTPKEDAAAVTIEALPRIRVAEPFEALRDASDRALTKTGARPGQSRLPGGPQARLGRSCSGSIIPTRPLPTRRPCKIWRTVRTLSLIHI